MTEEDFETQIKNADTIEDILKPLVELLGNGYDIWYDGRLTKIKVLVERVDGLRITIWPREHPPPHFHLEGNDIDASFSIDECKLIAGTVDSRSEKLIRWWHKRSKHLLIKKWNKMRPTDCLVGIYPKEK